MTLTQSNLEKLRQPKNVLSLVLATSVPFTERDYIRFGVDFWIHRGFRITIIDATDLVNRNVYIDRNHYSKWDNIEIRILQNKSHINSCRKILNTADLIIDSVTAQNPSIWNLLILRAIYRSKTKILLLSVNSFPGYAESASEGLSGVRRLENIFRRLREANLVNSIIARVPIQFLGLRHANYIVYGGRRSRRRITLVGKTTQEIWAHAMDYDRYLERKTHPAPAQPIAIFLDQGLTQHREYYQDPRFRKISERVYFDNLTKLFDRIERIAGVRVIISAHPHNVGEGLSTSFGGREVISGRSAELIAVSQMVIAHTSAAISLAVMYKKPICLVFSRDFMTAAPWREAYHLALARSLGKSPKFLEDIDQLSDIELEIDCSVPNTEYFSDHIKCRNFDDRKLWEIVYDKIFYQ